MLQFFKEEILETKVISTLAQVEARSAISRIERAKLISKTKKEIALNSLVVELNRTILQPVDLSAIATANAMIDRHSLRALDAVQLGSAIVARNLLESPNMRFIASDKALLKAARTEGFEVWDPET